MDAMIGTQGRRPARGFSLLELMIVVVITLVVAAVAIPGVLTATQNFKLRSTASSFSGLVQKCRMLAVARNTLNPVIPSSGGFTCTVNSTENKDILLPPDIVADTTAGGLSPSSMNMAWTSTAVVALPAFNQRGLPCIVSGGACTVTGQGYIYYFRQDRAVGATGWAAITVTPAGRAQVWTWDGSQWQ